MILSMNILLCAIMMIAHNAFAIKEPIKSYSNLNQNDLTKYYLAQIIPPGKYKVIIWDKLIKNNRPYTKALTSDGREIFDRLWSKPERHEFVFAYDQNSFNDYAQYFAHFYNVETNEQGQFLLEKRGRVAEWSLLNLFNRHYNLNITPMKGTALIQSDNKSVWQKVYSRGIRMPVDSVCNFSAENRFRCVINYFGTFDDWKLYTKSTLNDYLLKQPGVGAMQDRINFFLVNSFRHVLYEAKKKEYARNKMEAEDAAILGIYWNAFAKGNKIKILLERIRLVDARILGLINEFCQLDDMFLMGHLNLIKELDQTNDVQSFCPNWPSIHEKLSQINESNFVMDKFQYWIYSTDPIDNSTRGIVQFWLGMFSKWLNDYYYHTPWLELDLSLFNQIGQLLENGKAAQILTVEKIQRIRGIQDILDAICFGASYSAMDFLQNNGHHCHLMINRWRMKLCANCKFQYSSPPATTIQISLRLNSVPATPQRSPNHKHQSDSKNLSENVITTAAAASQSNSRCIMCWNNERLFAFTPCHHLCSCEQCAEHILEDENPNCPVCRAITNGKIRIYQP
uniref:RING-type domain-containing protein n=1 Tax=Globodera rostochiensis TaxID=31243 RepID=A0A914HGD3_GLORO